jgi:hypothetical protein
MVSHRGGEVRAIAWISYTHRIYLLPRTAAGYTAPRAARERVVRVSSAALRGLALSCFMLMSFPE